MTKEQEEAIERLTKKVDSWKCKRPRNPIIFNGLIDEIDTENNAIETVLSMLKEKDKELDIKEKQIEYIKNEYGKTIEEQGKQIDLMAEYINEIDVSEEICEGKTMCDENCKECIKQYFESKAEKE